ncbi:MAG: PilZ domain-containing protein [Kineosporiaceae bacterium]
MRSEVNGFVEAIRASERRGARRAEVNHPVRVTLADGPTVSGVIRNISLTGVAFEASRSAGISPGTQVRLVAETAHGQLDLTCAILRVNPAAEGRVLVAARTTYKRPRYEDALGSLLTD